MPPRARLLVLSNNFSQNLCHTSVRFRFHPELPGFPLHLSDEEDFALAEVICTSKIDVQDVVRKGLDLMRSEMS